MTDSLYGLIAICLATSASILAWTVVPGVERLLARCRTILHREWKSDDRIALYTGLATVILVAVLTRGWQYVPIASLLAGVAAAVTIKFVFRWREDERRLQRQREILLLFDTVELYMRSGLSMYHALDAARILTPNIRAEVGHALMYWTEGPAKALEILCSRLKSPEADILVSLLLQLEQAGIENFQDIVRREGRRLEQLKDAADRARINKRPFLMVMYRALPLLACLGMIAGAFFMHTIGTLKEAGIL